MRKVLGIALGVVILLGLTGAGIESLRSAAAEGETLIPAILLLALPILAVGFLAAALTQRIVRPLRERNTLVGVLGLGISAVLGVGVLAMNSDIPLQRPDAAVTAAVAPACAGQAVAAAAGLEADRSRLNHLVVLDQSGTEFSWTGKPSIEWRPSSVDDVELVACIQAEPTLTQIEVCTYNGPSTTRYSATRDVRVMAAQSGVQLARFTITDVPGDCPDVKSEDLPEMKGHVEWELVADHLASLVTTGAFVDPDPGQTWGPDETLEPYPTDEPIATPEPTAEVREVTLSKAIADGLVTVKATGDSLQRLDLRITSTADEPLSVTVWSGTMFVPKRAATQTMVVISSESIDVPAGETVEEALEVACAQMHDDQPGEAGKADAFTVKSTAAGGDLAKLLKADAFHDADFRVQQFAIWTITSNPTKSGYVHLGSFGVGSGPSAAELREIKSIFQDAGISTGKYRALP